MTAQDDDPKAQFRHAVYSTTLGVRAKLILIALSDVGQVAGLLCEIPGDAFLTISDRVTRTMSRVVRTVKALENAQVLRIAPTETGYLLSLHPENERHYAKFSAEGKRGGRG